MKRVGGKRSNYGVNAPLALLNHPSIAYRRQRDELVRKVVNFGAFFVSSERELQGGSFMGFKVVEAVFLKELLRFTSPSVTLGHLLRDQS